MFLHVEPLRSQRDMYCQGVKQFLFFIPLFVSFIEPETNESYNNDPSKSYFGTFYIRLCRIDCTTACLTLWSDNKWSKKKNICNVAFILLVNK